MNDADKKRILVLTPRLPYPVIGGDRLRIYQVCKALSARFSLTLLSLCETEAERDMNIPADGVFDRVERVLLTKTESYLNTFLAVPTSTPLQVAYYRSARFQTAVNRLLPEHDGVLSHLIRCGEYVQHADIPKFLEMTDAISLNYRRVRELKKKGGMKSAIYHFEANRLERYERQIVKNFDLSILVSGVDRAFLTNGSDAPSILVASNGVDLTGLPYTERPDPTPVVAFIGNMTSLQNIDAAQYFASEVLPILRRSSDTTFRVVGRINDNDSEQLRKFAGVEITGSVESVAAAVADAWIGICPVRMAAGVQNKVLEYMALGLPVITSRIGLEGLQAVPGRDLLVADTPEEYAREIQVLRGDSARRQELARNAREYVKTHHDWSGKLAPLVERIATCLHRH